MSLVKTITVGNVAYNVAQAPADRQKKLLLLVGGIVAMRAASAKVEEIDTKLLVGALMMLPEDKFDEVAQIVTAQTVINGEKTPIDVKSFQGSMLGYFELIAESIAYNLNDFFTWLDVDRNNAQQSVAKK